MFFQIQKPPNSMQKSASIDSFYTNTQASAGIVTQQQQQQQPQSQPQTQPFRVNNGIKANGNNIMDPSSSASNVHSTFQRKNLNFSLSNIIDSTNNVENIKMKPS
jgi:hypothetical protein